MNVLIVEDEQSLAREMASFLEKEHYLVEVSLTGMDASEKISVNLYDFILLDLGLPDYDGLDLLREAKEMNHEAAFIIITARGELDDRIKGLDLGADDYIAKPFSLLELNARMAAIARRKFGMKTSQIAFGEFSLDPLSRKVTCNGQEVDLTKKQFDLLHYLLLNKNRALTRIQLYEHIWGNLLGDEYDSNFIDVHIKNLRKKLAEYAPVDWLETVRGVGYRANID
jgi:DNA-binding response OmpR family regulator